MDLDFAVDRNLRELSGEEAWEAIQNFAQCQKEWDNPSNIISKQEVANLKALAKRLFGNKNVWVKMHRDITWDKVKNPNPQKPLNETQIEDLGLNTYDHDIPLSSREIPSFDEPKPQPQPFPSFPSLKVDLGEERDHEPPIRLPSLDSFRIKEVDHLTIHIPPSSHVASFHPKDTYYYYHPCIDDIKKDYRFKPGLLGQSGSDVYVWSRSPFLEHWFKLGGNKNVEVGGVVALGIAGADVAYVANSSVSKIAAVSLHNYVSGSDPGSVKKEDIEYC
uniref:Protein TIC110, chloroplastic n=1 Tax=Tanacetum cinerariifolium TaxID=118510 RepID=A0A6L2LLJ1_TANCI|nr:protein TIC110, chloroplastic [Tanacetum cinerariifolium]